MRLFHLMLFLSPKKKFPYPFSASLMPFGHNLGPSFPKRGALVSVYFPSFICPIIPSIYCPHFPFLCCVHHPFPLMTFLPFFIVLPVQTILPKYFFFSFYPKMHSTLQNGSSMPIVGNSPFQHSSTQQANILAQSETPATGKGETQNGDGNQLQVILTIRMLMQGKEVGSIIGKKGDYVRQIREQSGAKVNISDGSCPERIVTILGTANAIDKAFTMIAKKFEDDLQALHQQQSASITPPITLRLIIPASQCGSLIGKGGAKIREIRDKTGASLQVASEMLSNSTEKPVTISGSSDALIGCMREICQILLDAPAKGPTIQYKPVNTAYNPLAVANSAAAIAAAAAAQKNKSTGTAAGLPFGIAAAGHLQTHQLSALLPAMANPLQASLHELALLQHQSQHASNPFVDVSRFFLPTTAQSAPQNASASAVLSAQPASVLPNPNAALLVAMNPALIATSTAQNAAAAYKTQNGLEQLYGLDPMTIALLAQQNSAAGADYSAAILAAQFQQKQAPVSDPAQILQHQQQIQMLYQQQQTITGGAKSTGNHSQLSGRTIGSNGQALKENGAITTGTGAPSIHQQISTAGNAQKRFTPY